MPQQRQMFLKVEPYTKESEKQLDNMTPEFRIKEDGLNVANAPSRNIDFQITLPSGEATKKSSGPIGKE